MTDEAPTRRLVARFYNEDGREMPALYHDEEHGLICTWNYLFLVAPHVTTWEAALRQIGTPAHVPRNFDPLDWWQHRACKQAQLAREALGINAEELIRSTWEEATQAITDPTPAASAGPTVSDTSSRV